MPALEINFPPSSSGQCKVGREMWLLPLPLHRRRRCAQTLSRDPLLLQQPSAPAYTDRGKKQTLTCKGTAFHATFAPAFQSSGWFQNHPWTYFLTGQNYQSKPQLFFYLKNTVECTQALIKVHRIKCTVALIKTFFCL